MCVEPCISTSPTPCRTGFSCRTNPLFNVPVGTDEICLPGIPGVPCDTDDDCTALFYGEEVEVPAIPPHHPPGEPVRIAPAPLELPVPTPSLPCQASMLSPVWTSFFYRLTCETTDNLASPSSPGGCLPFELSIF